MFDWHSVFAVDPANSRHLVAPDIRNGVIKETIDGGMTWTPMTALTDLVTDSGRYLLWDGDEYHMQVTFLGFDPYRAGRLWVGTRDNGVFHHETSGDFAFDGTHAIKYVTAVTTTPGPVSYISSYGRGLWKLDETIDLHLPILNICAINPILCLIRVPGDPAEHRWDRREWVERDAALLVGGRIVGIDDANGPIASVEVTPGAYFVRPNAPDKPLPFKVVQTEKPRGFSGNKAALMAMQKNEVITGLVLNGAKLDSIVTMPRPITKADVTRAAAPPKPLPQRQPRLLVSSPGRGTGMPIVKRSGGELAVYGLNFDVDPDGGLAIVLVDGVAIDKLQLTPKGEAGGTIKLPALATGKHVIEVRPKRGRAAVAEFAVAAGEDER
jgi:hypothetical protein